MFTITLALQGIVLPLKLLLGNSGYSEVLNFSRLLKASIAAMVRGLDERSGSLFGYVDL